MKKGAVTLVIFLIVGLITGVIVGELLAPVPALAFLTKSVPITWQPKGDFQVVKYNLDFQVKLNLCSILGLVSAFLLYRKV